MIRPAPVVRAVVAITTIAVAATALFVDGDASGAGKKHRTRDRATPAVTLTPAPSTTGAEVSSLVPAPPEPGPSAWSLPTEPPVPTPPTVVIPDSIDHTGATDVSDALNAFIATVHDGSTIVFPEGSVYLLESTGIKLAGRHGLRLVGDGAALLLRTSGDGTDSAAFWLSNLGDVTCTDITIEGFLVVGENSAAGTLEAYQEREGVTGLWTGRGSRRTAAMLMPTTARMPPSTRTASRQPYPSTSHCVSGRTLRIQTL